ncbi:hypothetical protein [Sphingomonas sp.]|uniref:hypothetical protein n=1 Tax=Sphingomonas sp. TaxID=28214 RepID=UPI0035BBD55D
MNTNSDRHLSQLFVEGRIGCQSSSQLLTLVHSFENYTINHQDLPQLSAALSVDAGAYFDKGIITVFQALAGLDQGHESWALIKLYYAIYFFLRDELANDGIAILRCKNIYTLEVQYGAKPVKRAGPRYRGDHHATISLHQDRFIGRDLLTSQNIEGESPYNWMKDKREWINYRRRYFIDQVGARGISSADESFSKQIDRYCKDTIPIYCFDPDYAALALPIKRAQLSIKSRHNARQSIGEHSDRLSELINRSESCRAFLAAIN